MIEWFALYRVCWLTEPRHGEHEHFSGGRRRVADEDDTVLDDAHESSSVASQDRGDESKFVLHVTVSSQNGFYLQPLYAVVWVTGKATGL